MCIRDRYYNEWHETKLVKGTSDIKCYMDGTPKIRTIRSPSPALKSIQSKIKNKILSPIPLPENVHGGVKGKSNITNAKPHKGNKYQFTLSHIHI